MPLLRSRHPAQLIVFAFAGDSTMTTFLVKKSPPQKKSSRGGPRRRACAL